MALSGTSTLTSTTLETSTSQVTSQGNRPRLAAWWSPDDLSVTSPTFVEISDRVLEASIDRGRKSPLDTVADAGRATVVLNNQDRAFEPGYAASPYYPNVLPMRRLWLQAQWEGETIDRFYGFADSYPQEWPGQKFQEGAILATDGTKILALDRLPVTDPPRDTFADVVMFDQPYAYFHLDEPIGGSEIVDLSEGSHSMPGRGLPPTREYPGLVVGDLNTGVRFVSGGASKDGGYFNIQDAGSMPFDFVGGSQFGFECLFLMEAVSSFPSLWIGPLASPVLGPQTYVGFSGGAIQFKIVTAGTARTLNGATTVVAGQPYHLFCGWDGSTMRIYLNGVLDNSAGSITGVLDATDTSSARVATVGSAVAATSTFRLDEAVLYSHDLSTSRVAAHHTAAFNRGYAQELSGSRIAAAGLVGGLWGSNIQTGSFNVLPVYHRGQTKMEAVAEAAIAEGPDALVFFDGSGRLTYLGRDHRSSSPYNTVQATFDDDGTDISYRNLTLDPFGEEMLYNDVNNTREGGLTQGAEDATSINKYWRRDYSETGLILTTDADTLSRAQRIRDRFKDPLFVVDSLTLTSGKTDQANQIVRREVGDKIRVLRRPQGGTAIDQSLWINHMSLTMPRDGAPWEAVYEVSPR